jgi:SAM-dependent methyltransferase
VSDREELRATFDTAAELYDRARPRYPAELFDALVEITGVAHGAGVLEIGCATGIATEPLAERGLRITCVELGAELAAVARRNLARFDDVRVIHGSFDTWTPADGERFDLVIAATAWHWLDPRTRASRVWSVLRPGGHLAYWSGTHVVPDGGDPFFVELQDVYDEIDEGLPPDAVFPQPDELPDDSVELEATGLFDVVAVRRFDWETVHDADSYIDLLSTFSGHITMERWRRDRLYAEIRRRLARRADGRLRRHWGAVLHVTRRRG